LKFFDLQQQLVGAASVRKATEIMQKATYFSPSGSMQPVALQVGSVFIGDLPKTTFERTGSHFDEMIRVSPPLPRLDDTLPAAELEIDCGRMTD
jgi:hypothetical protein